MLRSEFEQRVNYKVTEEEFKSINEMYMDTDLDKDDFCLLYNASQFITQKVADVARERKQLREEKIQLGYWMADQFQKLGTMELRNKAVELLGARNYLLYVLQKKYAITDEDHSNEFRNEYYTEVDLTTLVISEDLTMRPETA